MADLSYCHGAKLDESPDTQDETPTQSLERLARRHNALLTVKNGNLVFAERGAGQSTAGSALTPVVITPSLVIDGTLDFEFADRQAFGKVVAYYQDKKQAKRIEVEASGEASSDSVYRIPEPFGDAAEADKAAQAKAKQLKRGEGSFSVDVIGDTSIQAGAPLVCEGIRPGLDGVEWLIDSVTHTIGKSGGFRSKISTKLSDGKGAKSKPGGCRRTRQTPSELISSYCSFSSMQIQRPRLSKHRFDGSCSSWLRTLLPCTARGSAGFGNSVRSGPSSASRMLEPDGSRPGKRRKE